ncbi:MAG: hypothetical protein ACJ0IB_09455 [Verrucomicrobiales bacterium]|nr:MAG: hypothetical protein CBC36_05960 [Verrucomicrobiaceae bacterium TMED76]RCL30329.1 MAG: hypothetical protein DBX02_04735 [Verrucomicrobiota bacterium]|tara:strand:- start:1294 stop:1881 length:588 start_codon:yes stop_codon:yes gene_type:complete
MRKLFIFIWLLIPLGAAAYHFGPGQESLKFDQAYQYINLAEKHLSDKEFAEAVVDFDKAISSLPNGDISIAKKVRLEKAKAQMQCSQLPEAYKNLESMLSELNENTEPKIRAEIKSTLANAQYYITWLMRLEGHPREVWEPVIESSRQNYYAAAEFTKSEGNQKTTDELLQNLEASIKLARMDLDELQGLPLPNQ